MERDLSLPILRAMRSEMVANNFLSDVEGTTLNERIVVHWYEGEDKYAMPGAQEAIGK